VKLRIGWVLIWVWRVYRRRWRLLIPLALLILLPQAAADAAFGDVQIERIHTAADVLKLATIPLSLAINLGGEALYAGIVAAGVVEWLAGRDPSAAPGQLLRSIRYGRLIAIDLILAIGTALGLVLLLVPGIVFYTYMAASPALVELNGLRVAEAMRKSYELVRGSVWRVLLFSLIVLAISDLATALLESPIHGTSGELVFNLLIEAVVMPFQGLTTVFLTLALLDLQGEDDRLTRFAARSERRLDCAA
jgi:hypothetical protein